MKPPSCLPKGLLCISTSNEWDFLLLHLHVGIWSCGFCFVFQFFGFEPLDFNRHAVVFHYFNLQLPNMDYIAIFSYAYVLCVYLLWWGICLHLMPILKWVILFFFLIAELEEFFVYFACKLSDTCFSIFSPSVWLVCSFPWWSSTLKSPWWLSGTEFACPCKRHGFNFWSGKTSHAVEQLSPCATII